MIIFLTLIYIALLAILVKVGAIKLTLFWKLSPILWMLLLLVALFLPMQWGAPSGDLLVLNYVVEIIPNVAGEVTDVVAEPLVPIAEGDVLFTIDARPYQAEVDRLEAALAAAKQDVHQLKAAFDAAAAALDQAIAQRDLAKLNFERAKSIQEGNPGAVSQLQVDQARQTLLAAEAGTQAATATKEQSRLAWKAEIRGENTTVAELKAQLDAARLNLDWTTVRAPSDGMVVNTFLRTGQRVANFPVRSWMAFQDDNGVRIAVAVPQYILRHIQPGQEAEVVLKLLPGETLNAKVKSVAPINSEGQVQASGLVPAWDSVADGAERFAVILELDDERVTPTSLPGGAAGTAAIYTNNVKMTHVIRRVMMRMNAWMNYILP